MGSSGEPVVLCLPRVAGTPAGTPFLVQLLEQRLFGPPS